MISVNYSKLKYQPRTKPRRRPGLLCAAHAVIAGGSAAEQILSSRRERGSVREEYLLLTANLAREIVEMIQRARRERERETRTSLASFHRRERNAERRPVCRRTTRTISRNNNRGEFGRDLARLLLSPRAQQHMPLSFPTSQLNQHIRALSPLRPRPEARNLKPLIHGRI